MKRLFMFLFVALMANVSFAEDRTLILQHLQGANSYFSIGIQDSGLLNGTYPGWCADWDRHIQDNTPYKFKFYSSYNENLPAGIIDHPENLDKANWIINQKFPGKDAGNGLGIYTSGDVQLAIWTLIDDSFDGSTVGPYSQARVDRIVARANAEGAGFYPTCKQEILIILDSGTPQSTMIEIKKKHFRKCRVPDSDEDI